MLPRILSPRGPRRLWNGPAVVVLSTLLALSFHASAQELARRLILKDGSYQSVTRYEVKGDRVRYLSAERNEWEELPSSLVDWPATEKFEKERTSGAAIPEAAALDKEHDKEIEADREAELSHQPQVAPGLRLPEDSGVFLLDNFQGQPQLVEVQQSSGDVDRDAKRNILRGMINPIASAKQTVELEGEHAAVQAHVTVPSIYLNVEEEDEAPSLVIPDKPAVQNKSANTTASPGATPQQPQSPQAQQPQSAQQAQQREQAVIPFDRFRIVRTQVKSGKRIVGDMKVAIYGKVSSEQHVVKTTITRASGGWLKLTPTEDLAPGEYVVVEIKGKEGMNLYMWDFGVNPKAPANANPWKPDTKEQAKPANQPADPPKPKEN
jgi:hypothetical protein